MEKSFLRHTAAFLLSVLAAVAFLLLGACLPQKSIDANVLRSAQGMVQQGCYPRMADGAFASILDYTTDALILAESKATAISRWDTILTNPQFQYDSADGSAVEDLYLYAQDENPQPTKFYVQYWMGFRPVVRLLLTFLDYYQILRYTALAFFVLFAAVCCSIAGHLGPKSAFLFALSVIFVRPYVVAVSLQFSCCFLLAFGAMLLVPRVKKSWESLFFLELGCLTMYFDFYTTPIVTFGLPMIYLFLLRQQEEPVKLGRIGRNALSWVSGYGLMWLAKLALTSLLTSVDGLGTGFASFGGRVGITKTPGMESYYNPLTALRTVAASLYSDRQGKIILLAAVVITLALVIRQFRKGGHTLHQLGQNSQLLVLAALPIAWFILAAQPTANHHWFQYRGITVTFWALFAYLHLLLRPEERPETIR